MKTTPASAASERAHALRILLVDDDRQLLATLQRVLEMEGHSVLSVDDGGRAIETLTNAQAGELPPFDVVVTDFRMPRTDGLAVAAAAKAAFTSLPVILLTGAGEEATHLARQGFVDRILAKPPVLSELRRALADLTVPVP